MKEYMCDKVDTFFAYCLQCVSLLSVSLTVDCLVEVVFYLSFLLHFNGICVSF